MSESIIEKRRGRRIRKISKVSSGLPITYFEDHRTAVTRISTEFTRSLF
jgi:hypothetical protein